MTSLKKLFLTSLFLLALTPHLWAASPPQQVTILFFNDLHGHLQPFTVKENDQSVEVGGIARLATLVKDIRAENDKRGGKTLVLVAGDILQGTPLSTIFTGQADIDALNAIGVNVMTVGNHEFDFGLDNFLALKKKASFPFISSNIIWRHNSQLLCDPTVSFKISDKVTLTIIGATTRELLSTTMPSNVAKIDVLSSLDTVQKYYPAASKQGPVILLSHSRFVTDSEIAEAAPGLTAIIGGHDQILLKPYRKVGTVPVFQAFEKGKYLGRLDLEVDGTSGQSRITAWDYIPIQAKITPDPAVAEIVASYTNRLDAKFKEVLGENRRLLDGERERIRYEETNLGDWVADTMREFSGAAVALINAGSLRASIDQGPITVAAVFSMMPYANEVVMIDLAGQELLAILTQAVKGSRTDEDGGFLHVSGIRFQINGKTVEKVMVGEKPLLPSQSYKVAITDFLAAGGDGYKIFSGKSALKTGLPLRELLVAQIRQKKQIDVKSDGRITRIASMEPERLGTQP